MEPQEQSNEKLHWLFHRISTVNTHSALCELEKGGPLEKYTLKGASSFE